MAPSPVREVIQAAVGGTTLAVPTDVSDPTQVAAMVEQTVAGFGRLDAAFNIITPALKAPGDLSET
jgi:NAD(P)-dependent dehydrogenase (short-subunit alcohol dehydrogenase family)